MLILKNDTVNIKLVIEYNGKNYFGWQRQKNKPTIQQKLEEALSIFFPKSKINLIGAGRTDTGVHALNQVANFKIGENEFKSVKTDKLLYPLNAILPDDISIKKINIYNNDFNARYSAKIRAYSYYFSTTKQAIYKDFSYKLSTPFDIDLANKFCKLIIGNHSFKSFCKNKSDKHEFRAIVYKAKIMKQRNGLICFEICANRFLHSMVRALAGAMIKTASNKISLDEIKNKLYSTGKGAELKIQYVPSKALFLKKIIY